MEHFTYDDYKNGHCDASQVGSAKQEVPSTSPEEPVGSISDQTEALLQRLGFEKFAKWAEANPGVIFPILAKQGVALMAKEQPVRLPDLDTLSPKDLEVYSSNDIKLMLLKSVGVTKKSDLQTE